MMLKHKRYDVRVTKLNGVASEWVAEGPMGREVKWRARITDDRPGELLSWMSMGDSDVETSGTVRFRPAGENGEQTLLQVRMTFRPPAGIDGGRSARYSAAEAHPLVLALRKRFAADIITREPITREEWFKRSQAGRADDTSQTGGDAVPGV